MFATIFKIMKGIFHWTWHFVVEAKVVMRLDDEKVLVASLGGAIRVTRIDLKSGQGIQQRLTVLAINGETKFLGLAGATVVSVIVSISASSNRRRESKQAAHAKLHTNSSLHGPNGVSGILAIGKICGCKDLRCGYQLNSLVKSLERESNFHDFDCTGSSQAKTFTA